MLRISLNITLALFCAALLMNLYRIVRGPSPMDRVLAIDTTYVNGVALVVLLGISLGSAIVFEVAMVIAMLGFVSTVAFARYLLNGRILN
ncbi:MAG TPA: K+/H+ antiporter subunit F [Gemmatimonadales bacterium]|nr:K+/H+ antiporter subunit F [Gemmatimonadales bacterium]